MPKPLVDLDRASLACAKKIAKLAGVRPGMPGLPMRATIQMTIREAMRAALPANDPRRGRTTTQRKAVDMSEIKSNLVLHAERELKILRQIDPIRLDDATDADILTAVQSFASQGHSGFSAADAIQRMHPGIITTLCGFAPLTPLTGEDSEWAVPEHESENIAFQNVRSSRVFKRPDGTCFDVSAIVVRKADGTLVNTSEHLKEVTFPYVPGLEIIDEPAEEPEPADQA